MDSILYTSNDKRHLIIYAILFVVTQILMVPILEPSGLIQFILCAVFGLFFLGGFCAWGIVHGTISKIISGLSSVLLGKSTFLIFNGLIGILFLVFVRAVYFFAVYCLSCFIGLFYLPYDVIKRIRNILKNAHKVSTL